MIAALLALATLAAPRPPWTTSRFVGTPEPPPPYRLEDAFPAIRFERPVEAVMGPGTGRFFVADRGGRITSFPARAGVTAADPFCELGRPGLKVDAIYGMAFHPRFPRVPYLYVTYVLPGRSEEGSRLVRLRVAGDPPRCDLASEKILFTWRSGGHNGGALAFARDGKLFLSTGDAAAPLPPDMDDVGQTLDDVLGAILRLDVGGDGPARAPRDNPFVRHPGARPEVWAYGLRNPWKISLDPTTGLLWVGDVGWETWEMIYLARPGGNYGWSVMEGPLKVRPEAQPGPTPILPPVAAHDHSEARSITGGHVYGGKALPELGGAYVYGDYETGKIWGLRWDERTRRVTWRRELADSRRNIVGFARDAAGELYALDYGGGIFTRSVAAGALYRIVRSPPPAATAAFPRRLGETGLFSDVGAHALAAGVVPYRIAAEPFADGARAERFAALPGDATVATGGEKWRFPKGAVLGRTVSRAGKRLETQVLHFDGETWNGYSYAWNEAGTDAELVGAAGAEVRGWHVSARAECGTCHNVWTGPPLGFGPAQLGGELAALAERRVLDAAPKARGAPLVDPYGPGDVAVRARAYLHANRAHCHRPNAGGLAALDLAHDVPLERTGALGTRPRLGTFGLADAAVIAPAAPERSVLLHRMATTGAGRMPRIGARLVDRAGVALIERWIKAMTPMGGDAAPTVDAAKLVAMAGDAAAGRKLFFEGAGGCVSCHAVGRQGAHFGPDLAGVGARQTRAQLVESLVAPSKVIDPKYVWHVAETVEGETHAGLLAERTDAGVVLRDAQGAATRIAAARLRRITPQAQSPMPEGLLAALIPQQAADLLAFLASLRAP